MTDISAHPLTGASSAGGHQIAGFVTALAGLVAPWLALAAVAAAASPREPDLGAVGMAALFAVTGVAPAVTGLVLAVRGRRRAAALVPPGPRGFGMAGLVIGIVGASGWGFCFAMAAVWVALAS